MGVRLVEVYKEDNLEDALKGRPISSFNGGGGCCASFMREGSYFSKGESMIVTFSDGNYYIHKEREDFESLFKSKLIQALVPGTEVLPWAPGEVGTTFFIPYKDLPGDQVATVCRLAKNWCYGSYKQNFGYIKKGFPELSLEDVAVLAVSAGTNVPPDSDSTVAFWSPTIAECLEELIKEKSKVWHIKVGPQAPHGPTCGHIINMLNGDIKPGIQPRWRDNSYFKAGGLPLHFMSIDRDYTRPLRLATEAEYKEKLKSMHLNNKFLLDYIEKLRNDHSIFPTVNYPVCAHDDGTPQIVGPGCLLRLKVFMNWVKANGVTWGDKPAKKEQASTEVTIEPAVVLPRVGPEPTPKPKRRVRKSSTSLFH